MAEYYLTDIPDDKWKDFKAACDLQGITLMQAFLEYIDITITMTKKYPGLYKPRPDTKPR